MTTVDLTAVVLWLGVTAYAVFGGADFGAGFWDLVGRGGRARAPRRGPDRRRDRAGLGGEPHLADLRPRHPLDGVPARVRGDHVDAVRAAQPGGARHRPARRRLRVPADRREPTGRRAAGAVFAISSVVTPFFLGAAAGAIACGRVPVGNAAGDPWTSWLNPTSVLVGLLAIAMCAYLAAVFLVADARRRSEPALAAYFLRRATLAGARRRRPGRRRDRRPPVRRPGPRRRADRSGLAARRRPVVLGPRRSSCSGDSAARDAGAGGRAPSSRSSGAGASPSTRTSCPGRCRSPTRPHRTARSVPCSSSSSSRRVVIAPSLALLYSLDQRSRLESHGLGTDIAEPAGHDG